MSVISNEDGEGEFLMLARNGLTEELQDLLTNNPSLNVNCKGRTKSNRGWTALHLSCYFGHLETVACLLDNGSDPNIKNFSGDTPLHKAAFTSREDIIHKLLDFNSSVFIKNDERSKPVDVACNSRVKEILQVAEKVQSLQLRENITTAAKEGNVELITNVLSVHPEIVNANTQDEFGNTPLHYAAMRDKQQAAVYLLHHGGDAAIANKEGYTAIDMCKTMQLRRLLEVQPIQNTVKNVQRFEGFLFKKRFMRPRLQWVVLDKGVLSYFARHADAVTGTKRRMFKYLTDAEIAVAEDNNHAFRIRFFDDTVHYLQVKKCPDSHISRQKWVQAFQLHVDYSSHYTKIGRLVDDDSDDEHDEYIQIVDIKNTVDTGFAHHELLKKQVDEFAAGVHKLAISDTSQSARMLLGKCHQILSISNEMTSSFSSCLKTLYQQDQVRKVQLSQEKEKTRVWQQAFEALATEHHNLERTLSHHSCASLQAMSVATSDERLGINGMERSGSADSDSSSDEDEFFDAYESDEDQDFTPKEVDSNTTTITAICESPPPNGHISKENTTTYYHHNHTEVHISQGFENSCVVNDDEIVDRTVISGNIATTVHAERHSRKFYGEKSMDSSEENLKGSTSTVSDSSRQFQDCEEFVYRKKLPVVMISRDDFSIWSILKQCIGKNVAAFSVSALASQLGRVGKPYNPLLGETYEYNRPDLGFHWVSEQVSHHPPISAFHATGSDKDFEFHGTINPKLKFWGRSVEVEPKGVMTLSLNKFDESYTWSNPHASVHNVVVGKPWIEQHGVVEILNHSTREKCVLNFKLHGWFRGDLNKVEGYILNSEKKKVRYIEGDWTMHLFSLSPETYEKYKQELNPHHKGKEKKNKVTLQQQWEILRALDASDDDCIKIWEAIPRPSYSKEYYSFTGYAMTLNQMAPDDSKILPPTDTRRRPDVSHQEDGSIENAGNEKCRLEEKQRAARKLRNKKKEEWLPRWFRNERNPVTENMDWIFDSTYKERDWSSCPDIF